MRKLLLKTMLLLCALIVGSESAWANEETFSIASYADSHSWVNSTAYTSPIAINADLTVTCVSGGNNGKYYSSNKSWRHYEGDSGAITIETTSGTLNSVTFTYTSGNNGVLKYSNTNVSSGTACDVSGETSVTFTVGHSSGTKNGNVQITQIVVNYTPSGGGGGGDLTASDLAITGAPVALSFDLYNNSSAQTVSYTTSSTGAVTVSGGSGYVTTSVSGNTITVTPVAVTPSAQTITVSQEADATYAAGSKTFTVTVTDSSPISNIAALTAKSAGNYTVSLTDALVTYVNGTNAYLEDASGAVLLYHCAGDLAVGDKITGTANVTYTVYNNLPEVTAFTLQTGYTKTSGNTVTPTEVTIATLEGNYTSYISRYVKIVGATVTSAFSSKNSTIEQSGSSIVLRDQNSSATLTTTVNDIVTVTAHPSIYNSTHQIAVYEQSQIVVAKVNPTITFNNGSVRVGNTLDLSTLFTSNSTGAVTYSITAGGSYASLDGSTLTGVAEGSVTVKAEQAESSSYNAGEAMATITVNPALVLSSIAVTTAPTKTTYNEGETFDPTGMVVTATYTDNTTEAVTGYTYSPNGALSTSDTEVTISYTESGVTRTTTQAITVNEVVDYATLPFSFDEGRANIENTTGLTQNGLDSDYNSSPKLKFKDQGTYVILKFNERPGTLTFDIKGNSFSGGTFKVQTSTDGTTYTDLKTYTELGSVQNESFNNLGENVRYIKWVYTSKSSGNVALGNIALAQYVAPATYELTWTTDANIDLYVFDENDMNNALTSGDKVLSGTTIYISPDPATGYELDELTVDGGSITPTDAGGGMYSFTMPAHNVAISATSKVEVAKVTYTLATSVVPGRHYIIVGGTTGLVEAMGSQKTNNRDVVEVNVGSTEGTVTVAEDAGVYEFLIGVDDNSGYFTIYDANANSTGYLYAASSGSNNLKTQATNDDNGLWTITFGEGGKAVITAQGENTHNVMRYNSINGLFSCYLSGQDDLYLYEKPGDTGTQNFSTSISAACNDGDGKYYGTFSAPFAFTVPNDVTVSEISVSGERLTVSNYAEGAVIPANTGVMISSSTSGSKTFTSAKGGTSVLGNENCLRPTYWGVTSTEMSATDDNCLFYRLTMHNGTEIGFWWGAEGGAAFAYDTGYRAYLAVPSGQASRVMGFSFNGVSTSVNGVGTMLDMNAPVYNVLGQRVSPSTKGILIQNGKKFINK